MTTPSSHSPLLTTLVNKTLDVLKVLIPKGSVFEGALASLAPLATTEPVQITLKPQEKKDLNLNHKPEFTQGMWDCSNCGVPCHHGIHVCPCGYGNCAHSGYYVRTSGNYKLTPFLKLDDFNPSKNTCSNEEPEMEVKKSHTRQYKDRHGFTRTKHLKNCTLNENCELFGSSLADKKVEQMCVASRPLMSSARMGAKSVKGEAIHEAQVVKIDGNTYLIEKMDDSCIYTFPCTVNENQVIKTKTNEVYNIRDGFGWREPSHKLTGKTIYKRMKDEPEYGLGGDNCQGWARDSFPEGNYPKRVKGISLLFHGLVAAITMSNGDKSKNRKRHRRIRH